MAKRKKPAPKHETKKNMWRYLLLVIPILLLLALAAWWFVDNRDTTTQNNQIANYSGPIGSVTNCQVRPEFINETNLSSEALIGTTVENVTGLAIVDPAQPELGALQHDTWDDAGFLGPYTYDALGNIYTASVPYVSLDINPPQEQNKIHRVDTKSLVMSEYIDLPSVQAPSETNPFGVLALAYDCDTNSLYAASVAGSTPTEELGRIFRIDLNTGEVADQFEGVDPFGVGVFNSAVGKRLYYGRTRNSVVYSIALDENGDFDGEPRREFSLADLGINSTDKIRRITFPSDSEMALKGVAFNYNPVVSSGAVQTVYRLQYLPNNDTWELLEVTAHDETP